MAISLQNVPGTLVQQLIFLAKTQIWKLCPWPDVHTECCQNRAAYTVGYAVFPSSIYRDTGPYLGKCEALE